MELELENILGIIMVLVGLVALGFVFNANSRFPAESELKKVTTNVITVIIFLMLFSIWHTLREMFHWKKTYGEVAEYPEYVFIMVAFLLLLKTAKHLYDTAKGLGIAR